MYGRRGAPANPNPTNHQPPTTNHQPPTTATNHQPPTTATKAIDAFESSSRSTHHLPARRVTPWRADGAGARSAARGAAVVARREVGDVRSLGRLQPIGPGRMGDAQPQYSRSQLVMARVA